MEILKLIRPKHWIKNLLILAPAFFGHTLESDSFTELMLALVSFSLMASTVYIINDISDKGQDALDERKKYRPLASGKVKVSVAAIVGGLLAVISVSIAYFLSTTVLALVLVYLIINILYSWQLKHLALVDLVLVASGYLIRIFIGAEVVGILVSNWMTILTFLFALFLALGRRGLNLNNHSVMESRRAYSGYNAEYIFQAQIYLAGVITIAYIMYTISPDVTARVDTNYLYVTSLPVILGFLRYFQIGLVEKKSIEPIHLLFKDRFTIGVLLIWLALFTYFLYV